MNTQRSIEERLWDYIDGLCSTEERRLIDELLHKDTGWKAKYAELLQTEALLRESELEQPSMRFTKNVMEEISKLHIAPATKTYINKKIIWGISIFYLVMIVGFLIYGFAQMGSGVSTDNTVIGKVSNFDFSKFFSNTWINAFLMLNVVVGLFLFDNYLTRKRKAFRRA